MIAIVDYGAGNLFSVQNALAYLNITCCTTDDPAVLEICDGVILPGVGAFPEAMHRLHASGLVSIICEQAQKKPMPGSMVYLILVSALVCRCCLSTAMNLRKRRGLD